MSNLEKAKNTLTEGGYTCVLCQGEIVVTSYERGVKPLVSLLQSGTSYQGFSAADKVVGRATAFLYVLLGVKELHAHVISAPALAVLEEAHLPTTYDTLVPNIINRTGTGICPFEEAVQPITSPTLAYQTILEKLKELQKQG